MEHSLVSRVFPEIVDDFIEIEGAFVLVDEESPGLVSNPLVQLDGLEVLLPTKVNFILSTSCILQLILHRNFVDRVFRKARLRQFHSTLLGLKV